MKEITQYDRVLNHLKRFGSITSWEAIMEYGITRISATIYQLRQDGYLIDSVVVCCRNRFNEPTHYVRYVLKEKGDK